MKTAKRATVALGALVAMLCLCVAFALGGGWLFAKADETPAPETAPLTVVLTTGVDKAGNGSPAGKLVSTATENLEGGAPDGAWNAAYPYRCYYNATGTCDLTIEFTQEIDTAMYKYAVFRALAWSAEGEYHMGVSKEGESAAIDTFAVNGTCDVTAVWQKRQKLCMSLTQYADAQGKLKKLTLHLPVATFSGYFLLSDFVCYADPVTPTSDVTLNLNGTQAEIPMCTEFKEGNFGGLFMDTDDGTKVQYGDNTGDMTLAFGDAYRYKAADFGYVEIDFVINRGGGSPLPRGDIEVKFYARSDVAKEHPLATAVNQSDENFRTTVRIPASALANTSGYLQNIVVTRTPANGVSGMNFFHNIVLKKGELPPAKTIDPAASGLSKAGTGGLLNAAGGALYAYDFQLMSVPQGEEVNILFSAPVDTNEYPYASFEWIFWGGSPYWAEVTVQANEKSQSVTAIQTYEQTRLPDSTVVLHLAALADSQGMLAGFTFAMPNCDGHTVLNDLRLQKEDDTEIVRYLARRNNPGAISLRKSTAGVEKPDLHVAHTVPSIEGRPSWADAYDFEQQNVKGKTVTVVLEEEIDTATYKYAEIDMLLWVKTGWYDITVAANAHTASLYVAAYEATGIVDSTVGFALAPLADNGGKIASLSFIMPAAFRGENGETDSALDGHLVFTDLTLKTEVPVPSAGEIDLRKTHGASKISKTEPCWPEMFSYQAEVRAEKTQVYPDKLTVFFAEPLDAQNYDYAVFNACLWGIPDFITVPVSAPYGNDTHTVDTFKVYSYWAETSAEIDKGNLLAKLPLAPLADTDGKIRQVTFDFGNAYPYGEQFSGYFLFEDFDCVQLEKANAAAAKDISELMPLGAEKSFAGVTAGKNGAFGAPVSARTVAYDSISFRVNATYTEHFDFAVLARAIRATDTVSASGNFNGILIRLTDTYAEVSAHTADGLLSAKKTGAFFDSGAAVKVRLDILASSLRDTVVGYTVRLTVGSETIGEFLMWKNDVLFGFYTQFLTADAGENFDVKVLSDAATPTAASDVMNVQLLATNTSGGAKRVPLTFRYNTFGGEEASAPVVSGAAHWDATSGCLVFDNEGDVTVTFSVTNAFGTFTSNTLTLSYKEPADTVSVTQKKSGCGCGSAVASVSSLAGVALVAVAALIIVRRKRAKTA